MTKHKLLIVLGIAVIPGLALAQTAIRPKILTAPQSAPAATEMTPEWVKEMTSLKNRVAILETKLNQSQQELAAFRQEYAAHTHAAYQTQLTWKNEDCESYDHAGVDDPDSWMCPQITKFNPLHRVASGPPIQEPPYKSLEN